MNALLSYLGLIGLRVIGDQASQKNQASSLEPYVPPSTEANSPTTVPAYDIPGTNNLDEGNPPLEGLTIAEKLEPQAPEDTKTQNEEGIVKVDTGNDEEIPQFSNNLEDTDNNPPPIEEPQQVTEQGAKDNEDGEVSKLVAETPNENENLESNSNENDENPSNEETSIDINNGQETLKNSTSVKNETLQTQNETEGVALPPNIKEDIAELQTYVIKESQLISKIFLLVILILLVLGYTALVILFSQHKLLPEIKSAILNGYNEFIEKQLPTKKLLPSQIKNLENLIWKVQDQENQGLVEVEKNFEGQRYKFEYKAKDYNQYFAPSSPIDLKNTESKVFYFEVEISYLHDLSKLVIGFTDKETAENLPKMHPGKYPNSIGFNLKSGEVYQNNEIVHVFKFQEVIKDMFEANESGMLDLTGSFFGIGVNLYYDKFFFTFNGTVLNGLSFQAATDIRYKTYDMRRKDLISESEGIRNKEKLNQITRKLQIKKEYRDELKNLKEFKCNFKNLIPVVFVEKFCRFYVNVGGSPFQLKDREIKHGILMGKN
jgi:hypothetical protein